MMSDRSSLLRMRPAAILLLLAAAACSVGPDYKPRELITGEGWSQPEPTPQPLTADDLGRFWERFDDPTLDRLVEAALEQNLGVRAAGTRVAEARATRDWVVGRQLPEISARYTVNDQRLSENGLLPIGRIPDLERDLTLVDVGADASWEVDLFGRSGRRLESAEALLASAQEEHRAAQFRIAAEVTRTYLALRGGQRRLGSVQAAIDAVKQTAKLVQLRVEAGEAAPLELHRVQADIRSLESRLPQMEAELRATALALSTLTGALPERELELLEQAPPPLELAPFPVGERADLLGRRPDLRAAERRLAAATANIGVAVAELYPHLSIGARGGFEAQDVGDLLRSSSATWSLVPAFSWRLFDRGRVRAEIRISEARAEGAALAWESAVLEALADAERALARYRGGLDALATRGEAVAAALKTRDLEQVRYESGESSLLSLLDAQRRLDEEEASLALTEVEASSELVSLIKALGGGWSGAELH